MVLGKMQFADFLSLILSCAVPDCLHELFCTNDTSITSCGESREPVAFPKQQAGINANAVSNHLELEDESMTIQHPTWGALCLTTASGFPGPHSNSYSPGQLDAPILRHMPAQVLNRDENWGSNRYAAQVRRRRQRQLIALADGYS
jgi:hypothetical protein